MELKHALNYKCMLQLYPLQQDLSTLSMSSKDYFALLEVSFCGSVHVQTNKHQQTGVSNTF